MIQFHRKFLFIEHVRDDEVEVFLIFGFEVYAKIGNCYSILGLVFKR